MAERKKTQPDEWPADLLVELKEAQNKAGSATPETVKALAASRNIAVNDVFGVASFYSFIATEPKGRHVIRLCQSLPCHLENADALLESIINALGVGPGETTADGRFSLEIASCIGLCDAPPAMLIDDDPHYDLNPEKIPQILEKYR